MNDKLKPCPFCGGKANVYRAIFNSYTVQCNECDMSTLHKIMKVDAIHSWNRRVDIATEREKYLENLIADNFLGQEGGFMCPFGYGYDDDCEDCKINDLCDEAWEIIEKAEAATNDK